MRTGSAASRTAAAAAPAFSLPDLASDDQENDHGQNKSDQDRRHYICEPLHLYHSFELVFANRLAKDMPRTIGAHVLRFCLKRTLFTNEIRVQRSPSSVKYFLVPWWSLGDGVNGSLFTFRFTMDHQPRPQGTTNFFCSNENL